MKARRLWPVTTALTCMLVSSMALELLAQHRAADTRRIEIHGNQPVSEEDWSADADGAFGPPLDRAHERARQLAIRGQYADALDKLTEVATAHGDLALLAAERAHVLLSAERPAEALELLRGVAPAVPVRPRVELDRAAALEAVGQEGQALAVLRGALASLPNHSGIRLALGELLREGDALDDAIAVLEPAARAGNNDERARALASLGRCYMQRGRNGKAEAALRQAIERAPASAAIWMHVARGFLESSSEQHQAAMLEHALGAAKLAPELPGAHALLGRVYERLERPRDAVAAYREAVRLHGDFAYPRKRLLRLALELEDDRLAKQQGEALLRIDPSRAEYHFLAGLAASRAGDLDAAREHYGTAIDQSEDGYPEAWYNLGLLEREAGHVEEAILAYRRSIELEPDYLAAYNNLGLVYLDADDFARAEAAFQKAIELDPHYAAAWTNLARSRSQHGDFEHAVEAYRKAIELSPPDRAMRVQLAIALRKTGQANAAIGVYRQLLASDPRYVTGWYNLGIALDAAGQSEPARQAYQQALSLDANHANALKNLALLEARLGLWETARDRLSEALDRSPADPELRLAFARAMLAENDLPSFCRAVRLVLAQEPGSAPAKALLGRCPR